SFHQKGIGVSVVATLEFHDVFATRIGTRQADGGHGGFRPRTDETHFFHSRKRGDHKFRQFGFAWRGSPETRAITRCPHHCFSDFRRSVPQNQRSPRADVINVFVAIGVPDSSTLTTHNERRIAANRLKGAHRRIHSAWNHGLGALLQSSRFFEPAGHRFVAYYTSQIQLGTTNARL